ncbi:MAG TPA: CHAT domain-containing protein, partial [Acidobacteriota bacterium]|nr:CHAT domain-containing protein [Acidobacteriota bacterium]
QDNVQDIPAFLRLCAAGVGSDPRYEILLRALFRTRGTVDSGLPLLELGECEGVLDRLRGYARELGLKTTPSAARDSVCYAAKANSFVVRADGRLNKCTVGLEEPNNQVGRIHGDGTVEVDASKLRWWMRGVWSGDAEERVCPLRGRAEPPAPSRPAFAPRLAVVGLTLLLAGGAAMAGPARAALPIAADSAGVSGAPAVGGAPADTGAALESRPTLDTIRIWNKTGRSSVAERAARALLADAERDHGPESVEAAEILDEIAIALRRTGRSGEPEALEICERALRIKERAFGRDDPRVAASLHNLGLLHRARQDPRRALAILEETLVIQERGLGRNDPSIAKTLLALGSVCADLEDYDTALPYMEGGIAIEEIALGPGDPQRAAGIDALAGLRYAMGDFAGAVPLYAEAIRLWEESPTPNPATVASSCSNLGGIYLEIGDYPKAIELLERSVRLYEQETAGREILLARALTSLGSAYDDAGEATRAIETLQRAVRILDAIDPRDTEFCLPLTKLGWLRLAGGAPDRAEEALQRSLAIQLGAPEADRSFLWITLRGLAMVARERGEWERARAYYEQAVEQVRSTSGPAHPDMGRTLAEFASFDLAAGDSLAAFETALRAAELNRDHLRLTLAGITERQALALTAQLDTGLDIAFAAIAGTLRLRSEDLIRRLWDSEVRSRALVLDEIGGRARWVEGAGELLDAARRLEAARGRLANLLVRGSSAGTPTPTPDLIAPARAEVEERERVLAARSSKFRTELDHAASGLDRVLAHLPRGSALVSYVGYGRGRDRSYLAMVVGATRALAVVPLGDASEIDHLIARWRALAGTPPKGGVRGAARAEDECRTAGSALRSRIWDPFAGLLADARLVLVVPVGTISLVGLAALPGRSGGYLVEVPPTIHYVSTERDIVRGSRAHAHGAGLLAVGDPAFDHAEVPAFSGSGDSVVASSPRLGAVSVLAYRDALASSDDFRAARFASLPGTHREIDEVVALWGRARGVIVLEGDRAGERSVKDLLPGRRVAHFATHGFFLDGSAGVRRDSGPPAEAPVRSETRGIGGLTSGKPAAPSPRTIRNPFHLSGLALTGANLRGRAGPDDEDGILVAEEIASLDLSSLDWIVLSACQTGLGEVHSGEGVLGFRRAFEIAGAGTLIMSLWAVEDDSARDWMRRLYEGRLQGMLDTSEAVQEAHLGVLRSLRGQGRAPHPFYWAAFIATGDWR